MRIKRLMVFGALALAACSPGLEQPSYSAKLKAERLVNLGTIALRQGEMEKAEAGFRSAFEVTPLASAVDGLGAVAFMKNEFVVAETLFQKALALDPEYGEALGHLGLLYEVRGNVKLAEEYYRKALVALPSDGKIRNNYAGFLKRQKASEQDIRQFLLQAQALQQANGELHSLISDNLQKMGVLE